MAASSHPSDLGVPSHGTIDLAGQPWLYEGDVVRCPGAAFVPFLASSIRASIASRPLLSTLLDGDEVTKSHADGPTDLELCSRVQTSLGLFADGFPLLVQLVRADGEQEDLPSWDASMLVREVVFAHGKGSTVHRSTGSVELRGDFFCGFLHGFSVLDASSRSLSTIGCDLGARSAFHSVFGVRWGPAVELQSTGVRLTCMLAPSAEHRRSVVVGPCEEVHPGGVRLLGPMKEGEWHGSVLAHWPHGAIEMWVMNHGHLVSKCGVNPTKEAADRVESSLGVPIVPSYLLKHLRAGPSRVELHTSGMKELLLEDQAKMASAHRGVSHAESGLHVAIPAEERPVSQSLVDQDAAVVWARASTEVRKLLSSVTVEDLGGGSAAGDVVTVRMDDSVESALKKLSDHSILSCPVFDESANGGKGSYVAVVHVADIFAGMIETLARHSEEASAVAPPRPGGAPHRSPLVGTDESLGDKHMVRHRSSSGLNDLRSSLAHQRRFLTLTVKDILNMAISVKNSGSVTPAGSAHRLDAAVPPEITPRKDALASDAGTPPNLTPRELPRHAFRQLPAGCPAVYAAHVLAAGAHAVPVVNSEGEIVRVVTQADIIRFLASGIDYIPSTASLTLSDLGLDQAGAKRLVVARFDEMTIDVFRRMRRAGCSAVPVLDTYGSMAANLSMTDAKAVAKHSSVSSLQVPVSAFFREIISEARDIRSPSIYCRGADRLSRCIQMLAATKIHQVYFVDSTVRPTGVLRVSDVLRALLGEEP
jgi:CBS domain-containing protein